MAQWGEKNDIVGSYTNIYCGLGHDANPKVLMKRRHKGGTQTYCLTDATNDTASKALRSTEAGAGKKKVVFIYLIFFLSHQTFSPQIP